jgi:Haem-NO-binding
MQGIIFVTWEKFLAERFGISLLNTYRAAIGQTPATSPLVSKVYNDETLLAGVGAACKLTGLSADMMLREYGRYFMINGLTSHLCAYLLTQVHNGRELLLTMSDAHAQMRRTADGLTPPLFEYEVISSDLNTLALVYDSPRKLCSVLLGAIEGAAERYGEKVKVVERTCMKRGAPVCRFEMRFFPPPSMQQAQLVTPMQQARRRTQQQLADLVLSALPDVDGVTLSEVQETLQRWQTHPSHLRPSILLEALQHLVHAGLASSTANQPGDNLTLRRYWRAPTWGSNRANPLSEQLKR